MDTTGQGTGPGLTQDSGQTADSGPSGETAQDGADRPENPPSPARTGRKAQARFAAAGAAFIRYVRARYVGLGLFTAGAVFLADQASKALLLHGAGLMHFLPGQRIEILPFFDLVMVWNQGVSFGLLPHGGWAAQAVLVLFALAVVGALGVWLNSVRRGILAVAIGSVMGGAIGNVVDRVLYGAVADFFDAHAYGYHWYVFNVADAFIVLGVGLLLYDTLTAERRAGRRNHARGESHG